MARKGPPPKPGPLRLLEGNRGHRPIPPEPIATPGPCDPPKHLNPEVREVWGQLAGELESKGLLAPRYLIAFEVLCESVVAWRKAAQAVSHGVLVVGLHGRPVSNPASREFARYAYLVHQFGGDFGLSPAAVTAIAKGGRDWPDDGLSPARLLR